MCRWLGYAGAPVRVRELLYDTERSLIEQSRRHSEGIPLPNGDGTGLGWYGRHPEPALFRSMAPAWGEENLQELASEIESRMFLAHVRAATGTAVQQTNCHPFRHGRWLFVHNGFIDGYDRIRRDLMYAIAPELFGGVRGSTDSEVMFHLALTFGLQDDPFGGLARMAGLIEQIGAAHDIAEPLQMTIGLTDGEVLRAVRYSSGPQPNSLHVSEDLDSVRALYPESERLQHFPDGGRVVVSEPLVALPGAWREVPPSTSVLIDGSLQLQPFAPQPPG